jgi:outer membrane receptor protein involved in Fe transport
MFVHLYDYNQYDGETMRADPKNLMLVLAASAAALPMAARAQASAAPEQVAEVVVTGSRISRRDYVSDSPIVTVGPQVMASSGVPTIEGALNQLPQVDASAGSASSFNARGGQASIDLRGLGQQRTLVLLNGRRLQPSNPDGSVDLNIVPKSLVDNVEVITGGASAVYGSDAVTGVVNLKLKQKFTGAEIDAQFGTSDHGDANSYNLTGILGANFAGDRGNVFVAADYADRNGLSFTKRGYLKDQALTTTYPNGILLVNSANLPTQAAVNGVFGAYGVPSGTVSRSSQLGFNTDGSLFLGLTNYRGSRAEPFTIYNGGLYSDTGYFNYAQVPLKKEALFAHLSYEVDPRFTVFVEGLYTHYTALTAGPPPNSSSTSNLLVVPITNPFIPADLRSVLASRPNPTAPFNIQKRFDILGPRSEHDEYDVYQATVGANGEFGDGVLSGWSWDSDVSYGRTEYTATEINYPLVSATNALLAAPDGGVSQCAGGFNPFGLQPFSQACRAFITRNAQNHTILDQLIVEGTAQGKVFTLPAGDVKAAIGADYRRNSYRFTPSPFVAAGDLANYNPILASRGHTDVKEIYAELLAPVLRDLPLVQELNLDLGYRYSRYDIAGGQSTYKADFDWRVAGGLRLRGGFARAIRAPSVGELYSAASQNSISLGTIGLASSGDPCDIRSAYRAGGAPSAAAVRALCIAEGIPASFVDAFQNTTSRTPFTTSGNTNLEPEKADTFSLGAVWRPGFDAALFSHVTLSVDYYNIKLNGAVGVITAPLAVQKCFNADGSNPPLSTSNFYCGLITRNPSSGLITNVTTPALNLGGYKSSGVDVEGDWSFDLGAVGLADSDGRLSLSTVVSYLDKFEIQTLPGGSTYDYAGTIGNLQIDTLADAHPTWKAISTATYDRGPLSLSVKWRYIGRMGNANNVGTTSTLPPVKAVSYFDLDGLWRVNEKVELRVGVVNVADRHPPTVLASPIGQYTTDLNTYDLIGRRYYVSVKARF